MMIFEIKMAYKCFSTAILIREIRFTINYKKKIFILNILIKRHLVDSKLEI